MQLVAMLLLSSHLLNAVARRCSIREPNPKSRWAFGSCAVAAAAAAAAASGAATQQTLGNKRRKHHYDVYQLKYSAHCDVMS
jgi:hypothetical protein